MKKSDKECCNVDLESLKRISDVMDITEDEDALNDLMSILKALSDPTRLQIMYLLRNNDFCVCEIMHILNKPQSTVSHHLNVLKNAGILKPCKKGLWIYYTLKEPQIGKFLDSISTLNFQDK